MQGVCEAGRVQTSASRGEKLSRTFTQHIDMRVEIYNPRTLMRNVIEVPVQPYTGIRLRFVDVECRIDWLIYDLAGSIWLAGGEAYYPFPAPHGKVPNVREALLKLGFEEVRGE
jgi:hypothetical protein